MAGPPGFEPGTAGVSRTGMPSMRLEGRRSVLAELRAHRLWSLYFWAYQGFATSISYPSRF